MSKLRQLESAAIDRLNGYLEAAQYAFQKVPCDVTLEASFFEIVDPDIKDEDVVMAVYGSTNPIELRRDCSLEEMIGDVHETLTLPRRLWNSEYPGVPTIIEENLRDGYWRHLRSCFDYTEARIVKLGHDVPYVNIFSGFTYVLYALDMSQCAILMGNTTD